MSIGAGRRRSPKEMRLGLGTSPTIGRRMPQGVLWYSTFWHLHFALNLRPDRLNVRYYTSENHSTKPTTAQVDVSLSTLEGSNNRVVARNILQPNGQSGTGHSSSAVIIQTLERKLPCVWRYAGYIPWGGRVLNNICNRHDQS